LPEPRFREDHSVIIVKLYIFWTVHRREEQTA
jgi:hypothetical protein